MKPLPSQAPEGPVATPHHPRPEPRVQYVTREVAVLLKNEGRLSTWVASTFGWLVPLVFERCKSTDSTGCRSDIGKRPPYIASGRARYQTPTANSRQSGFLLSKVLLYPALIPASMPRTCEFRIWVRLICLHAPPLKLQNCLPILPTILLTILVTGLCDKAGSVMLHVTDSPGRIETAAAKASAWATAQLHCREWQTRLQNEEENKGGGGERGGKRHTEKGPTSASNGSITSTCGGGGWLRWNAPRSPD